MNSIQTEAGGFQKVVFESVIDTLAGGATLDVTGFENDDDEIPAGTLVGPKDPATGLHPIVTESGAEDDELSGDVIGMVHYTVPLISDGNNFVGVVIEGAARKAALPDNYDAAHAAIATAIPKITLV